MTNKLIPFKDRIARKKTVVTAHRGAMGYAPENTLAAYNLAVEMDTDAIELDVHLSKEGIPVIIHDFILERTTSGKGLVRNYTLDELKSLDIGSWFDSRFSSERMLTLEEVCQWAKGQVYILVEIKNNPMKYRGIESKVLDILQRYDMIDQVEVFSFDHGLIKRINQLTLDIITGVCYAADPVSHAALALKADARIIHPQFHHCTKEAIEEGHQHSLYVTTWTVNDMKAARELAEAGVDCIKTDYPDKLREMVDSLFGK